MCLMSKSLYSVININVEVDCFAGTDKLVIINECIWASILKTKH